MSRSKASPPPSAGSGRQSSQNASNALPTPYQLGMMARLCIHEKTQGMARICVKPPAPRLAGREADWHHRQLVDWRGLVPVVEEAGHLVDEGAVGVFARLGSCSIAARQSGCDSV